MAHKLRALCNRLGLTPAVLAAHAPVLAPFVAGMGAGLLALYAWVGLQSLLALWNALFWAVAALAAACGFAAGLNVAFWHAERRLMTHVERGWLAAMAAFVPVGMAGLAVLALSLSSALVRVLAGVGGDPGAVAAPAPLPLLACLLAGLLGGPASAGVAWAASSARTQAWFAARRRLPSKKL